MTVRQAMKSWAGTARLCVCVVVLIGSAGIVLTLGNDITAVAVEVAATTLASSQL